MPITKEQDYGHRETLQYIVAGDGAAHGCRCPGMEGKETVATCREMVSYLKAKNRELKAYALARPFSGNEEEIRYFKYYKPALTGRLLYYYRVYQIESGCPGCLRVAETYYRRAWNEPSG